MAAVLDLWMISLPMMEMLVDVHSTTKHSCNTYTTICSQIYNQFIIIDACFCFLLVYIEVDYTELRTRTAMGSLILNSAVEMMVSAGNRRVTATT